MVQVSLCQPPSADRRHHLHRRWVRLVLSHIAAPLVLTLLLAAFEQNPVFRCTPLLRRDDARRRGVLTNLVLALPFFMAVWIVIAMIFVSWIPEVV